MDVLKRRQKSNNLIFISLILTHLLGILIIKLMSCIVIKIIWHYIHWLKWLGNYRTCHIFIRVKAPICNDFGDCCHLQNILLLNVTVLRVLIIPVIISLVVLLLIVILYFVIILLQFFGHWRQIHSFRKIWNWINQFSFFRFSVII